VRGITRWEKPIKGVTDPTEDNPAGGRLLEAKPDNSHGLEGTGYEYWITK